VTTQIQAAQTFTDTTTDTVTQFVTDTKEITNVEIQTVIQSTVILQTQLLTTTNSAGQSVVETVVSSSIATVSAIIGSAGQGTGNALQTQNDTSGGNSTPIAAIVGGAVGGFACLALLAFLIFVGVRRGWFDNREAGQPVAPVVPAPVFVQGGDVGYYNPGAQGQMGQMGGMGAAGMGMGQMGQGMASNRSSTPFSNESPSPVYAAPMYENIQEMAGDKRY
jgi:hypothetical protein